MIGPSSILVFCSALVVFSLGVVHFIFTFRGHKLYPRNLALKTTLSQMQLMLTPETNMWSAWLGFNASHSLGALLFGSVYGYLSLLHSGMLFQSAFLLLLGLSSLSCYLWLAKRYWFSVPFWSFMLALVLYVCAVTIEFI